MAEQERSQSKGRSESSEAADAQAADAVETETDLDALDDLLDEIDGVLEENAEDFVKNYVQKGGQ